MPQEIERKFLVVNDDWRPLADRGRRLRQAYIAAGRRAVVRVRIEDGRSAWLTIKSAEPALSRQEFEYEIPLADAEALAVLNEGAVEKTRFRVPHAGRTFEVDVYSGENAGLVIAEVEIDSETAAVELPAWAGREVTGDKRYYAASLARHPFRIWAGAPDA